MSADRCPRPGPIRVLAAATASLLFASPASGQRAETLFDDLEVCGCLAADAEVVQQLDALSAEHVAELERRGYKRAWRRLRKRLKHSSPDGRALVEAWLDSPDRARRIYLCEDELPLPVEGLLVADFADLALDDLAGRWWQEEGRLAGADADREGAATSLDERRRALLQRFDAMYDNREPEVQLARLDLEERLADFDEAHVEPWHLGLDAEGTEIHFEPDPVMLGVTLDNATVADLARVLPVIGHAVAWFEHLLPEPPDMSPPQPFADLDYEPGPRVPLFVDDGFQRGNVATGASSIPQMGLATEAQDLVGGKIPDPKDLAEMIRTEAGWARQREALRREIRGEERRLAALEDELERGGAEGGELDRLARDVERSRRRLARLSEDTRRYQVRVQEHQGNRPWVTGMLQGSKREAIDGLQRVDRRAVEAVEAAKVVVEEVVETGASRPGTGLGGEGGAHSGPPRPSGTTVAGRREGTASAGSDVEPNTRGAVPDGLEVPEGAITWEGSLPPPSSSWESGLVNELLDAHPELDETDARILLGLIDRSLGPGGGRDAVAELVRGQLAEQGRLGLRGGEARLSELYRPGLLEDEQVQVVFVLEVASAP